MASALELYPLGEDSKIHPDVPQGTIAEHSWTSQIFPGSVRTYWVYIPAQYQPEKPACGMIFQDGWSVVETTGRACMPVIFDNLIAKNEMPITVGIFVNPGVAPRMGKDGKSIRMNRSFEYDSLSDRYARFLLEELLPEIRKNVNLSSDPNDWAICGGSSGGIAAFTAAWQRPDAFRRVFSFIGSFSNLRGGDIYPSLIRKTEPKPIRVFLQSGKKDMNTFAGNWYLANQHMLDSFEYMGYDVKAVFGEEGHNGIHFESIVPDALRWLWRDYPQPIAIPVPPPIREWVRDAFDARVGWESVPAVGSSIGALTVNDEGELFYADGDGNIRRLETDGKTPLFKADTGKVTGLAFDPGGRLWACRPEDGRIEVYAVDGNVEKTIVVDGHPFHLVIDTQGGIFFIGSEDYKIRRYDPSEDKSHVVYEGCFRPTGLCFSHDAAKVAVACAQRRWVYSFLIQADGTLGNGEPYYRLEISDDSSATRVDGMVMDAAGQLYIATEIGIQIADGEGRVGFIAANPSSDPIDSLVFAGREFQLLYAAVGGRIFSRPAKQRGRPAIQSGI